MNQLSSSQFSGIILHVDSGAIRLPGYDRFMQHVTRGGLPIASNQQLPVEDILDPFEELFAAAAAAEQFFSFDLNSIDTGSADSLMNIAQSMGISTARTLLFSDTPSVTAIGKEVGMTTIGIATQYDVEQFERADFIMKHFGDEALRQLF